MDGDASELELEVTLAALRTVRGRVLDVEGAPLASVRVRPVPRGEPRQTGIQRAGVLVKQRLAPRI